ncbi:MAG: hypothetical protein AB7I38_03765 [Dehalococcoidia bacterium]
MRRACRAIAHGGGPCQAPPLRDDDFCRMHSPEHAEAVADARRLGGQRRRRDATLGTVYDLDGLESVAQIRRVVEIGVLGALELENSLARSRTLAYLAQVALRTLEVGELEERLSALEAAMRTRSSSKAGSA